MPIRTILGIESLPDIASLAAEAEEVWFVDSNNKMGASRRPGLVRAREAESTCPRAI
jgi:hypothetical protein